MTEIEQPRIYLISPPEFDLTEFPDRLASVLDAHDVACLRLALSSKDEDYLSRAADACRDVAIERDVAIVIDDHSVLADRLGLDGVHLADPRGSLRDARKLLGPDAIVGAFCGVSRHDGMNAGEAGADYVSFGPVGTTALGDGAQATTELFEWWSEVIEVPVVAEGALDEEVITRLAPYTDFFGVAEIWDKPDPAAALSGWLSRMS